MGEVYSYERGLLVIERLLLVRILAPERLLLLRLLVTERLLCWCALRAGVKLSDSLLYVRHSLPSNCRCGTLLFRARAPLSRAPSSPPPMSKAFACTPSPRAR